MTLQPIKIKGKEATPQKSLKNPIIGSKNVLTNSRWEFVELWLRKEKKDDALFFWKQSREFSRAATGLGIESSPLLHYYSFMNAVKALLSSKGIFFNPHHGVKSSSNTNAKISLDNEGITIKNSGILPSLSNYIGETELIKSHTLKEIFFNLPFIHRTYCLSYSKQTDMYIPVKNARFLFDKTSKNVHLYCELSDNFSNRYVVNRLPPTFVVDKIENEKYIIKSTIFKTITSASKPNQNDINQLVELNENIRKELFYINGSHTLWYIKSIVAGPTRINRYPMTLTLGAMHRLSELCRYKPLELQTFLSSNKNWLISEFIQQAPEQFLDEISSEITGYQFLQPNIRMAT